MICGSLEHLRKEGTATLSPDLWNQRPQGINLAAGLGELWRAANKSTKNPVIAAAEKCIEAQKEEKQCGPAKSIQLRARSRRLTAWPPPWNTWSMPPSAACCSGTSCADAAISIANT